MNLSNYAIIILALFNLSIGSVIFLIMQVMIIFEFRTMNKNFIRLKDNLKNR
jgi:hypothetical protein